MGILGTLKIGYTLYCSCKSLIELKRMDEEVKAFETDIKKLEGEWEDVLKDIKNTIG